MADKWVILKFDGELRTRGFRVTLEVEKEGHRPEDFMGDLPADPELADAIAQYWEGDYVPLIRGQARAIRPGKIDYGGSITDKVEDCKRSGRILSDRVNAWLQSPDFRDALDKLQRQLQPTEEIHFLIRIEDTLLHKLPWETWKIFEAYPKSQYSYASLSASAPTLVRKPSEKRKVRILAILGDCGGINGEADIKALGQLSDVAEVHTLVEPGSEQINDELWVQPWDIIFFAGHSNTEGETGYLQINPDEAMPICRDSQLWFGLKKAVENGLQLVIFNSCDGLGLAKQLDDLHVPQVVFMRELVVDFAAQQFLKDFLRAYIGGSSLQLAVKEAKEKLRGLKVAIPNWEEKVEVPYAEWLPVIWQNPAVFPPKWEDLLPHSPQSVLSDWKTAVGASLAATVLVVGLRALGLFFPWEMQAYDAMMRMRPAEPPDSRLLLVTIDDDDIRYQKERGMQVSGSLADEALLQVLQKFEPHQPNAIGVATIRDGPVKVPELAERYRKDKRLFVACSFPGSQEDKSSVGPPQGVPSDNQGFTNIIQDVDGPVRRYILYNFARTTHRCRGEYSLAASLAIHYLKTHLVLTKPAFEEKQMQLGTVVLRGLGGRVGAYQGRETSEAQILLNYRPILLNYSETLPETVSLSEVLQGNVSLENVRGKIVMIGPKTSTAKRRFLTPYSKGRQSYEEVPALYIHAQATSALLSAVLQERTYLAPAPEWADWAWIAGWSLVGSFLFLGLRSGRDRTIALGIALCLLTGSSYLLFLRGTWIALVPAAIALIASPGFAIAYAHSRSRIIASHPVYTS